MYIKYLSNFWKSLFYHLWWSLSSIDFYRRVYSTYSGYGIKYCSIISAIATIIYSIFILSNIAALNDYFVNGKVSSITENLDYIFPQLPDFDYDGKSIQLNTEEVLYIKNKKNQQVIAFDINNNLDYTQRTHIPFVITKNNLLISVLTIDNKIHSMPIKLEKILGTEARSFNNNIIKEVFATIVGTLPRIFIYLIVPLLVIKNIVIALFDQVLIILVMYGTTYLFGPKISIKQCVRMSIFANGIIIFLQPLVGTILPEMKFLIFAIQNWTNFLLIKSLIDIKRNT